MAVRNGLVAVAAMAVAICAGVELRSAQSFTIPDACCSARRIAPRFAAA